MLALGHMYMAVKELEDIIDVCVRRRLWYGSWYVSDGKGSREAAL